MTGVRVAAVLGVVLASVAGGTGAVAGSCIAKDGEVHLAGGEFQMGDDGFYAEEGPAIRLAVDGFAIDLHEVTNRQFRAFVDATGYVTSAERTAVAWAHAAVRAARSLKRMAM